MKYGILARFSDHVKYVSSTRFRPDLTTDITNIALFVQESSAISAVKTIRKDGEEPKGCTLEVVEIDFHITRHTPVEYPAFKEGYMLVSPTLPTNSQFFTGTKKEGQYSSFHHFGNVERATIFRTEKDAQRRQMQLIANAEHNIIRETNHPYLNHWLTQEQRQTQHAQLIETAKKILEQMKNLQIVKAQE